MMPQRFACSWHYNDINFLKLDFLLFNLCMHHLWAIGGNEDIVSQNWAFFLNHHVHYKIIFDTIGKYK